MHHLLIAITLFSMPFLSFAEGLINVKSSEGNVTEVADRLETVIEQKGLKLFTRINHTEGAASVGLTLRPTIVLLFGNPKVGTPLMQCTQTAGIDLPQKALVWEDEKGEVWITYNDPQYLGQRHEISETCAETISKIGKALSSVANTAAQPLSPVDEEHSEPTASYDIETGRLNIPALDVHDIFGGVKTYSVELRQVSHETPLLFLVESAVPLQ